MPLSPYQPSAAQRSIAQRRALAEQHTAHARLIAAAPQLLAACEAVRAWTQAADGACDLCRSEGGGEPHAPDCPAAQLQAAIAQATQPC